MQTFLTYEMRENFLTTMTIIIFLPKKNIIPMFQTFLLIVFIADTPISNIILFATDSRYFN